MAIQHRRGGYNDMDPAQLVPGEPAAALYDDPFSSDGRALYYCFAPGSVKRVTMYEDFLDYFGESKREIVQWITDTACAEYKEEYAAIRDDAKTAEAERVENEKKRVSAEESRRSAEGARAGAEEKRAAAEEKRVLTIEDFEKKVAGGFFDGATFRPSVSEDGLLSWSNDKGLPNPETVSVRGPKGSDGVVTGLGTGMYALQIVDGRLRLYYDEGTDVPDMEIRADGHLWALVGGE
ncbi:hypothetical protein VJ923_07360 [Adlercreutzia sp. R25]|uniref:hypothetical protein n=1 Tax=Adlercreutzia shanghongiae TaxID=3111773 RepID=UPI002DB77380|nr:hypothetical protein [Adlercreutzia sp. R25]MEC4272972.1 hypothetical protein [Adlercreutzia sp. R25]